MKKGQIIEGVIERVDFPNKGKTGTEKITDKNNSHDRTAKRNRKYKGSFLSGLTLFKSTRHLTY